MSSGHDPGAAFLEALARRIAELVHELGTSAEQTPPTTPPRYLTATEAAAMARVSTRTIRNWARTGALSRHGEGRPLYRRDELEELLERRERSPERTPSPPQAAPPPRRRT